MPIELGIPKTLADAPLPRRLAWVTGARLLLLVAALSVIGTLYLRGDQGMATFSAQVAWGTLAFSFASAGIYAAVLRSGKHLDALATAQLLVDQLTWTAVVYVSGATASGATSFYGLTCLIGATLTGQRGATIAAFAGGTLYSVLALLMQRGVIAPPPDQPARLYHLSNSEVLYYVLVNLLMLVVVALLSSYLSERLRLASGQLVKAEERAEQAERMAALGRLAAGLAHEIRNPLGSIAGSIQLLRDAPALSEDERQLCDIIQRETARLDDLVTDMMDLTRRRAPEPSDVDVAAIAREVVELAGKSGRAASDVSVSYSGLEHATVHADAAQLRQLIWNLVRNAVQASGAGDSVHVSVERLSGRLRLKVEDEGVGIDSEAKQRIFDAFFTTRSHGTGMGLAVVKAIADEHGFGVEVRSEHGTGAAFEVDLGVERADGPEGSA